MTEWVRPIVHLCHMVMFSSCYNSFFRHFKDKRQSHFFFFCAGWWWWCVRVRFVVWSFLMLKLLLLSTKHVWRSLFCIFFCFCFYFWSHSFSRHLLCSVLLYISSFSVRVLHLEELLLFKIVWVVFRHYVLKSIARLTVVSLWFH